VLQFGFLSLGLVAMGLWLVSPTRSSAAMVKWALTKGAAH
jgi:hypothetical protein